MVRMTVLMMVLMMTIMKKMMTMVMIIVLMMLMPVWKIFLQRALAWRSSDIVISCQGLWFWWLFDQFVKWKGKVFSKSDPGQQFSNTSVNPRPAAKQDISPSKDPQKSFFVKMDNVEEEQPDTLPGFKMQSENFVLKFVTGLQKGVCRYSLEKNSKSQFSTFCVQQAAWVRDRLVRHDGDPPQQARGWTCRPG